MKLSLPQVTNPDGLRRHCRAVVSWCRRLASFRARMGSRIRQIETAEIDRGEIRKIVSTSGSVEALVTVDVGSQVSGQISELFADYNSPVKKGQVIAQIDPRIYETRVEQAQGRSGRRQGHGRRPESQYLARPRPILFRRSGTSTATRNSRRAATFPQAALDTATSQFESAKADVATAEAQLKNAAGQRHAGYCGPRIRPDRSRAHQDPLADRRHRYSSAASRSARP